jgi:hypothetical protein
MAAFNIPPSTVICGRPWTVWYEAARRNLKKEPTADEVADYIQRHEFNQGRIKHLASGKPDMDQIEAMRRQEREFQQMLREKYPHLVEQYMDHIKNLHA